MVSDRVRASAPEYASLTRNKSLADALDISHESMASRTAGGFYKTLVDGVNYLSENFDVGHEDPFDQITVDSSDTND